MSAHALDSSKEEPLRTDIRLLGRLLGDTVREQEGEAVFDIVERVRQTAIRFARDGESPPPAELVSTVLGAVAHAVPMRRRLLARFLPASMLMGRQG